MSKTQTSFRDDMLFTYQMSQIQKQVSVFTQFVECKPTQLLEVLKAFIVDSTHHIGHIRSKLFQKKTAQHYSQT